MKVYEGVGVYFPAFLTWTLGGGEWSASRPRPLYPHGKGPALAIKSEAGQAPEPVWTDCWEEKSLAKSNHDSSVVHIVA